MTPSMIPQDLSALNIFEPSLLISVLPLAYDYFLSVVTPFFFFSVLLGGSLDLIHHCVSASSTVPGHILVS